AVQTPPAELSKTPDLIRMGASLGPADGCSNSMLLWREPPHYSLLLAQFDPYYYSPVHEHLHFWVVGCGYRGRDRWDMYERLDDGSVPGHAHLELVDQWEFGPGETVVMPAPPRAIHSHNNDHDEPLWELIFSAAPGLTPAERLLY